MLTYVCCSAMPTELNNAPTDFAVASRNVTFTGLSTTANSSTSFTTEAAEDEAFTKCPQKETVTSLLILLGSYLCVSAFWYQLHPNISHRNLKWTNRLCVMASIVLLAQCIWFTVETYTTTLCESSICVVYSIVGVSLGIVNKFVVYIVLWLRQYSFYNSSSAAQSSSKVISIISWVTMVGIILFSLTQAIAFNLRPWKNTSTSCKVDPGSKTLYWISYLSYIAFLLCQVSVLILIILPICRHLRKKNKVNSKMRDVVIRLSVCTCVCIVSDVIPLGLAMLALQHPVSLFIHFMFKCSCVINVISLYASFSDYARRLMPFCIDCKNEKIPRAIALTFEKPKAKTLSV